jgi:hypothetical protein
MGVQGCYVKEAEDDAHFHFIAVEEEELVIGYVPRVIDAERIDAHLRCRDSLPRFKVFWPGPSRAEERERFREDVVVDEAGVY